MKKDVRRYIVKKSLGLVLTLFFVTMLSFFLMRLSTVDPATAYARRSIGNPSQEQIEAIRVQWGFDKPLIIQYGKWVVNLFHLDLGTSLSNGHSVWQEISLAFPKTMMIVFLSAVIQVICIVLISCISYILPWKIPKKILRFLCIIGISIPSFYVATVYLDFFAVQRKLISVAGNTNFIEYLSPAICLAVFCVAFYVPLLTDSLERESNEDYAFYARCRGLSEVRLLFLHMLPRAIIGLIPSFMQNIGLCLASATIIERIFSIPGFGYLIVNSVLERDTPMIHAAVFFLALSLALCNIIADLIQWKIQKRIEVE